MQAADIIQRKYANNSITILILAFNNNYISQWNWNYKLIKVTQD